MTLFEEIIKEALLITEDVNITSVNDAIKGLHPAWIKYDDETAGAKTGKRIIYPVAYGLTKAGNPVVRAFQPQGASKRGVPKWKFFRLDRIKSGSWRTVNSRTFNPGELTGFNDAGDGSMSVVFTISPIGNAKKLYNQPTTNKEPEVEKPAEKDNRTFFDKIGLKPISKKEIEKSGIGTSTTGTQPNNNAYTADNAIDDILKNIGGKSIDNVRQNDYLKTDTDSKMMGKDTEPVAKTDIKEPTLSTPATNDSTKDNNPGVTANNNEPVYKNDITTKFSDLTTRMNNVQNDDDETEELISQAGSIYESK